MAGETIVTVVGNLTGDPELRWTQSGAAVAKFTIASTPRFYDRNSGQWKDGEAMFMRCSLWRDAASNAADSLSKGMRVIAQGRLQQSNWEDRETGARRSAIEMQVDEIGPSLRYATAEVKRMERSGGGFGGGASGGGNSGFGGGAAGGSFGTDNFGGGGGNFGGGNFGGGAPAAGPQGGANFDSNNNTSEDPWAPDDTQSPNF